MYDPILTSVAIFDKMNLRFQAGKGGELTHDETTIISGALDLTEKTARDAMTPLSRVFSLDLNAKLDKYAATSVPLSPFKVYILVFLLIFLSSVTRWIWS